MSKTFSFKMGYIQAQLKIVKKMEKEQWNIKMEISMKDNGRIIFRMVKENKLEKILLILDNFQTEKKKDSDK